MFFKLPLIPLFFVLIYLFLNFGFKWKMHVLYQVVIM